MRAMLWGYFDAPNALLAGGEGMASVPVALTLAEAERFRMPLTRFLVLETGENVLLVVNAKKASGPLTLSPEAKCDLIRESGDEWHVRRQRDGQEVIVPRESMPT